MPVVIARIDDRYVHGQVTVGWTRPYGINRIVVVSDPLASDPMQSMMLQMAAPPGVAIDILSTTQGIQRLTGGSLEKYRVMLIFPGPFEPLALIRAGVPLRSINVGGIRFSQGRVQIAKAVSVSPDEQAAFKQIIACGVDVEVRMFPTDPKIELSSLLPK